MTATFAADRLARLALDLFALRPDAVDETLIETVAVSTPTMVGIRPGDRDGADAWDDAKIGPHLLTIATGGRITTARLLALTDGPVETDETSPQADSAARQDRHDRDEATLADRPVIVTVWASARVVIVRSWTVGAEAASYAVHTARSAA